VYRIHRHLSTRYTFSMTFKDHYRFFLIVILLIAFFGALIAVKIQPSPLEPLHLPIAGER